jgi:rod shape-determining protein MreD
VNGPGVKLPLVVVAALVLQDSLLAQLRVLDVSAELMMLLPICAGVLRGPERGAAVGFGAGLALDLLLSTPFGMSALAYTLVGYFAGLVQGTILRASWWIPVLTAAAASAAGVVVYVMVASVVGQSGLVNGRLWTIMAVVAVLNGLLSVAVLPLVRWALAGGREPRAFAA